MSKRSVALSLAVIGSFAAYAAAQHWFAGRDTVAAPAAPWSQPVFAEDRPLLPLAAPEPQARDLFQLAVLREETPPLLPAAGVQLVANTPLKDGTFKGTRADAYFGPLQVSAVITGGKLVDVQVIDYPHDRSRSQRINQQALPALKKEAIALQSAAVHIISGATPTSRAFSESLSAALRAAQ